MDTVDLYDIFIVGGGINGCGIARDAAGRGYSVFLAEQDDLASGTSSASTKLIHGGLRYLEYYEFRLVREALMEREVLWKNAPHIIWPMRFVLPHHSGLRPVWLLRLGLFLYDHLGGRKQLPATRVLDLRSDPAGKVLKSGFSRAFEYSDCWVDDSRLVVLNARDAVDRGATVRTRTRVLGAEQDGQTWVVKVEDLRSGSITNVRARALINAAGPWVDDMLRRIAGHGNEHNVRLVQGSHIVVPRKFDDPRPYFFQNEDGRIFFAILYEEDFTLIGTTDHDFEGDPSGPVVTEEEIEYLCEAASEYFSEPILREQVVWSYTGIRPLFDDGASEAKEATRDYVLKDETRQGSPLLVNAFGGKITTYRKLASAMLTIIEKHLGRKGPEWTESAPLPGGDFPVTGFGKLVANLLKRHPFLAEVHARRLSRLYGTCAEAVVAGANSLDDLGENFGSDLFAREVDYLIEREWAMTGEDVLWRRTKRGLHLSEDEKARLNDYVESKMESAN